MRQARGNAAVRKVEGRVLAGTLFWLAPPDGGWRAPRSRHIDSIGDSTDSIGDIGDSIDSIDGGGPRSLPQGLDMTTKVDLIRLRGF